MFNKQTITHLFQPIMKTKNKKVIGYEALLRHRLVADPLMFFKIARDLGKLTTLDMLSIEKAVETFNFKSGKLLFLNIFPTTLLTAEFAPFLNSLLSSFRIVPSQIMFELNETSEEKEIWNNPQLKNRVLELREYGFRIAMDDVGVGAASLKQVIEYKPDMIKLDRYFSIHLAESEEKQAILTFFVDYCNKQNYDLVLEGIENVEDLAVAKRLNVLYVQGYYIGKPSPYTSTEELSI